MTPDERLQHIHDHWGGALAKMAEGPKPGEPAPYACEPCGGTGYAMLDDSGEVASGVTCKTCNGTGTAVRS